jgi:serine/threonine-protein kinase
LAPEESSYYNSRGHAYYRLGDVREALQDYTLALRIDSNSAEALTNRGDLYTDLGYYEKAVADYQNAVRSAPDSDRAYQSAAWLMATCPDSKWRSTDGALEAAAKAIELGGNGDPRYLDTLAAAQANAGNYATAQRILQRAIQIADKSTEGHYRTRLALYEKQQPYRLKRLSLDEVIAERKKQTAEQQATYDEQTERR